MFLRLAERLTLALTSPEPQLTQAWEGLFLGGGEPEPTAVPDFQLDIATTTAPLPLPPCPPLAHIPRPVYGGRTHHLTIYQPTPTQYHLLFDEQALVRVDLATGQAHGVLADGALVANGRFLDLTLTSLGPFLRRRGLALVHGCVVAQGEEALLLLGGVGSGKTTAALSLVLGGWHWVADDVVLLAEEEEGVVAWPLTARVGVRPSSGQWLALPEQLPTISAVGGVRLTQLAYTQLADAPTTRRQTLPRSIALAHLSEASVDQWDAPTMAGQFALLERLCQQARPFALALGRDVAELPRWWEQK